MRRDGRNPHDLLETARSSGEFRPLWRGDFPPGLPESPRQSGRRPIQREGVVHGAGGVFDAGSSTVTAILISEVEIMPMLMPASPRALNMVAATPECERMPMPTAESLAMPASVSIFEFGAGRQAAA